MLKDIFSHYKVYLDNFNLEDSESRRKLIKSGHYKEFVHSIVNELDHHVDVWDVSISEVLDKTIGRFNGGIVKAVDLKTGLEVDNTPYGYLISGLDRSTWKHELDEGTVYNLDHLENAANYVEPEDVVWFMIQYIYFNIKYPEHLAGWKADATKSYDYFEKFLTKERG